jgi:hypothetical protein
MLLNKVDFLLKKEFKEERFNVVPVRSFVTAIKYVTGSDQDPFVFLEL